MEGLVSYDSDSDQEHPSASTSLPSSTSNPSVPPPSSDLTASTPDPDRGTTDEPPLKKHKKDKKEKKSKKQKEKSVSKPTTKLPSAATLLSSAAIPTFLTPSIIQSKHASLETYIQQNEQVSEPCNEHTSVAKRKREEEQEKIRNDTKREEQFKQHDETLLADAHKKFLQQERLDKKKLARGQPINATAGVARKDNYMMLKAKSQREAGQSSVTGWKPEAWMKMRQEYD